MNNIIDYNGKEIRTVNVNGEEKYNIYDILTNALGYKKADRELNRINKKIEDNTGLVPFWDNLPFKSKKDNKRYKQPVATYKQLVFILQFINSPKTIPFKLFIAEKLDKDKNIDTNIFDLIANRETTKNRQRINKTLQKLNTPQLHIDTRTYNVKLNTTLREFISEEELPGSIAKVQRIHGKVVFGKYPSEKLKELGLTNAHRLRDYCTHEENRLFQFMEEQLLEMLTNHKGRLTREILYKYADKSAEQGIGYKKVSESYILHVSSSDNRVQSNFDTLLVK